MAETSLLELATRTATEHDFSGVVQIDCGDHTDISLAAGFADRRHQVANAPTTRFGTASAAKGFTALTVMSLVSDGTLQLDGPVRPLLGDDLPLIDDEVTIRQLLAHRSGIGDYLDEESGIDINDHVIVVPVHQLSSTEAYLAVLDGFPQRERPGETFRYNNGAYVVLALIAERASNCAYHRLVDERVVRPAGLTATSFPRGDELPADVAIGYLHPDGMRSNVLHLPVIGVGDGGIVTTAADVHRFWCAVVSGRVVPEALWQSMIEPVSDPADGSERYGLGFWLHPTGGQVMLEGMDAGVSFRSVHDPDTATTLTILSNTSDGAWPMARALETALGLRT